MLGTDGVPALKEKQIVKRQNSIRRKITHSAYYREMEKDGRSLKDCSLWLRKADFSAETESKVFAAQDGVLLTRSYRNRIFKAGINANCRNGCGRRETVLHILAACKAYNFSLYKNRHDQIVVEVARMIMRKFNLRGSLKIDEGHVSVEPVNFNIHYWSWNYRGCWHQTCPPIVPR